MSDIEGIRQHVIDIDVDMITTFRKHVAMGNRD
jgi:hypothetical protein